MLLRGLLFCSALAAALWGCADGDAPTNSSSSGVDAAALAGNQYAVVIEGDSGSMLLGRLHFGEISGGMLPGSWRLETWGTNTAVPALPANNEKSFPEAADLGEFSALVFGDLVIVPLTLPGAQQASIGLTLDSMEGDRPRGTATLLPAGTALGRLDAMPVHP